MRRCGCCNRDITPSHWDGIYGSCHDCAFEASLEHFPCDHGASGRTPMVMDSTASWVGIVLREMPNATAAKMLEEVMRRSKGSVNPKSALDMIHNAKKGGA